MCPSYRATMEEKHSTRGRAHLLFEMMHGDVIRDGWKSQEVFDALDLCLSCKGCKGDCPVNVDMATYKAEFLSHYYENRLAASLRLCNGLDSPLGASGVASLPESPTSWRSCREQSTGGHRAGTRVAEVRRHNLQGVVPKTWNAQQGQCPRSFSGLTRSTTTSIRDVAAAATEVLEDAGFRCSCAAGAALLRPTTLRLWIPG